MRTLGITGCCFFGTPTLWFFPSLGVGAQGTRVSLFRGTGTETQEGWASGTSLSPTGHRVLPVPWGTATLLTVVQEHSQPYSPALLTGSGPGLPAPTALFSPSLPSPVLSGPNLHPWASILLCGPLPCSLSASPPISETQSPRLRGWVGGEHPPQGEELERTVNNRWQ